jgi:hypothetical protein
MSEGRSKLLRAAIAAGLVVVLAACSSQGPGWRESLGLSAPPPDPFLTVARAPLEMPPSLGALPPPQPGAPSRVDPNPTAEAQAALGTGFSTVGAAPTSGESALISAAGAETADPAIREQVVAETPQPERRFGLDSLFGVPIVQDPAADARRLDAEAEAERLRREGGTAPTPDFPASGG